MTCILKRGKFSSKSEKTCLWAAFIVGIVDHSGLWDFVFGASCPNSKAISHFSTTAI